MKKVLVTGKNSYIGRSFKSYVEANYPSEIQVDSISVRGEEWRDYDFSGYDAVLHVAALVHKNEKDISLNSYLKVNKDLTVSIAKKAKLSGVKHFIFVSSIAVYGKVEYISEDTTLNPTTKYGISKLEAEESLHSLENSTFRTTIVRPPMIYGLKCPGNYSRLSTLAHKIKFYPKFTNQRSMIFIDNLSEFFRKMILKESSGVYLPQNKDYVDTSTLLREIRKANGKTTVLLFGFSRVLKFLTQRIAILSKVYGNLTIDFKLSGFDLDYDSVGFKKSIEKTEGV